MPARELRAPQRCVATPQGRGRTQKTRSSSEDSWQHQHAPQDRFYAGSCPNRGIRACWSDKCQRPRKAFPNQPGDGRFWLKLCHLRNRGKIESWDHDVFVASAGPSASFMRLFCGHFPCLRPGNTYASLEQSFWHITKDLVALALQGMGEEEERQGHSACMASMTPPCGSWPATPLQQTFVVPF